MHIGYIYPPKVNILTQTSTMIFISHHYLDGDVVSLALLAKTPVADGTVSGDVRWWNESVSGILRKGCTELYSPLFSLKKIAKKSHTLFRDGPAIHPPDDNP